MKNKLLPLFVVLGSMSAYSQVGIGTKTPNASAQLEVTTLDAKDNSDKGMLIPRVQLTSTKDKTTITNGNVNSLMVFNTVTIADITPGYYYWYIDSWKRLAVSGEAGSGGTGKDGEVGVKEGLVPPGAEGTPTYPGRNVNIYTDITSGIVYVQKSDGTWTSINGKDGKDGISGGIGAPGKDGVTVPAETTIYVDSTTGIVYILTPGSDPKNSDNWLPINGKNGIDGKNGINGGNGAPGTIGAPGLDGTIEMYIDYKTGIVYVRDPKDNTKWVSLNGKDGISGGNGAPGKDGVSIPSDTNIYVDSSTGIVYVLTPGKDPLDPKNWIAINGKDGAAGNNGKDGMVGGDGAPGTTGAIYFGHV